MAEARMVRGCLVGSTRQRPVVCVDFDGVILRRTGKWRAPHVIEGEVVAGSMDALKRMLGRYTVVIHTTRALTPEGRNAVKDWLDANEFRGLFAPVTARKVCAVASIDDRPLPFEGDWVATLARLRGFKPWTEADRVRDGGGEEGEPDARCQQSAGARDWSRRSGDARGGIRNLF